MKKLLLGLLLTAFALTGSIAAMDFDVITGFNGAAVPAGKFYVPVTDQIDVLFGASAYVPGKKSEEIGVALLAGIATELPLLGNTDIYLNISKPGMTSTGVPLTVDSLVVAKNWMFRLTDEVTIGLTAELASIGLQGEKDVILLSYITPAIGATISLF